MFLDPKGQVLNTTYVHYLLPKNMIAATPIHFHHAGNCHAITLLYKVIQRCHMHTVRGRAHTCYVKWLSIPQEVNV